MDRTVETDDLPMGKAADGFYFRWNGNLAGGNVI
jgi:hypothetical protein